MGYKQPFHGGGRISIDQGRVDYALFDVYQEIQVIVEAKKLDANINDKDIFLSLVKYAFFFGVTDIFLTDGLRWHHFTDFKPGQQEPNKSLSLKDDNLVEVAAYLVQRLDAARYWPEDKDVDELSRQINQLTSEINSIKLELAKIKTEAVKEKTDAQELVVLKILTIDWQCHTYKTISSQTSKPNNRCCKNLD